MIIFSQKIKITSPASKALTQEPRLLICLSGTACHQIEAFFKQKHYFNLWFNSHSLFSKILVARLFLGVLESRDVDLQNR